MDALSQLGTGWLGKRPFTLSLLAALLLLLSANPFVTQAQGEDDSYWQFPFNAPISHLLPIDYNKNGVEELLIASEDGELFLIGADGLPVWQFETSAPVYALGTAKITPEESRSAFAIANQNSLMLLSPDGEQLWSRPLSAFDLSPAQLTAVDASLTEAWRLAYPANPVAIEAIDATGDGQDNLVVLFESGQVQVFGAAGEPLWNYSHNTTPGEDASPQLAVADLNRDGQEEIVLTTFRRFSQLTILEANGDLFWDQPIGITGRATALAIIDFPQLPGLSIAVGTERGDLNLYNAARQRVWPRTLNVPISSIAVSQQDDQPVLLVGTETSLLVAFDGAGKRLWSTELDPTATRSVENLVAVEAAPNESQPAISAVLGNAPGVEIAQDLVLLNQYGRILNIQPRADESGLSRLANLNHDNFAELIVTQFSSVDFLGLGIGANETTSQWQEPLNESPRSTLAVDIDQDGQQELIIGTRNGRVFCLENDGSYCWLHLLGDNIIHLATIDQQTEAETNGVIRNLVVVRERVEFEETDPERPVESFVELRRANGDLIWSKPFNDAITAIHVANVNDSPESEILLGTLNGEIHILAADNSELWSYRLTDDLLPLNSTRSINHLFVVPNLFTQTPELLIVTPQNLFKQSLNQAPRLIWQYPNAEIEQLFVLGDPVSSLDTHSVAVMDDGTLRGHQWNGRQLPPWPFSANGRILATLPANSITLDPATGEEQTAAFLIATQAGQLVRLEIINNQPQIAWQRPAPSNITGLFWGDLDGDSLPDAAIGSQNSITVLTNGRQSPTFASTLTVSGRIYALVKLERQQNGSDLVAISTNGEVELFRAQENRPPLATNPRVEQTANGYNFSISVVDVENSSIDVTLELFDGTEWVSEGTKTATNNLAVWNDQRLPNDGTTPYRFVFTDGIYTGVIEPPAIEPPASVTAIENTTPYLIAVLSFIAIVLFGITVWQAQLPDAKARRFYGRLKKTPLRTFQLIEKRYAQQRGSEDFLLNLARFGRQNQDEIVANYADGLYLLPDRPLSGLPIILSAISTAAEKTPRWHDIDYWRDVFHVTYALVEAPTLNELALLRPQLKQLVRSFEGVGSWSPAFDALLPILTDIRDSQRVDHPDDKLVYLNEAAHDLQMLHFNLPEFQHRLEKTATAVIATRWSNLVTAEIQELQGRAELVLTLKTRRLVPAETLQLVVSVRNNGRSSAEKVTVQLTLDPAYRAITEAINIELLPSGREKELVFDVQPLVSDRFRLGVEARFSDQLQEGRTVDFGDMVSLLPPIRDFKPISNPYLPGTPLRPKSNIFFGRDQLFNFIADNAAGWAQRNVLILIGQRRTGKTSALLRLRDRLPDQLVPIYIDCQSLGIIPGMAALFQELAWLISDTLINLDIEIDVPDLEEWEADPRGLFQRKFIPDVRALLPEGSMLLFVFDEFEAFEHLVENQILPPTFFTYLRHLMQHSEGISFLFVGTRRLEEMSADYWSVLFNIALYERIDFLSYRSAMRLISEPVAPNLVYDDLALEKIWRVTAGHPYFLQLVCYTLVKQANDNQNPYITISDVNAGLDEMLSLGEVHFAYIWQRSTFAERAMLTAVANQMPQEVAFYPEDLVQFLEQYNIILSPVEVTQALTSLVEREIFREVAPGISAQYELRVGLVGLWVAKHKSLSKLHAMPTD